MSLTAPSKVAIGLLNERSRDALVDELGSVFDQLEPDEAVAFIADLLLAAGADRDQLKARVVSLLASRFGRSSERSSQDQLDLFASALRVVAGEDAAAKDATGDDGKADDATVTPASAATIIEETNADVEAAIAAKRLADKEARAARRAAAELEAAADGNSIPWPSNLPVRTDRRELPAELASCDDCGAERKIIRYEQSWRLEYTTTVEVVVTQTPVAACGSHHGGPVRLPVLPKPVDKGQLGFSLASRMLWLRITHNLPVRRIAEMLQAEGAPVSESMVHTLISVTGQRSRPVIEAIKARVQQATLVNLDDTFTDVHEAAGRGKRKRRRARVWLALGDEQFAYYFATKTWKASEAEEALGPIAGVLQGDGYKGFPGYADKHGTTLAGCMAHLRRKFRKAVKAHDPRATEPMALVQGLYRVEKLAELRALDADERLALRQERSVPIMAELQQWAVEVAPTIVRGSPLGKAWTYLNNQQEPLQVFLHDGAVSIDNNAAERGLRRHTIGRKLWLFFRDQDKLEHVARLMSLLTTARLHGVDELAYTQWLLEQLARREWSTAAAQRLLPDAWLAMQQKQAEELGA